MDHRGRKLLSVLSLAAMGAYTLGLTYPATTQGLVHPPRLSTLIKATSGVSVAASFTNGAGKTIADQSQVAVGTSLLVVPRSTGIVNPWYQIWVKAPGGAWQNAFGYDPAPKSGFSVAVTKPGTYQIAIYVSASAQGTHWVEAKYAFTAKGSALIPLPKALNGPTVSATFTNVNGKALANHATVGVGGAIVVHPASTAMNSPWYQIWVKAPGSAWQNAYGYDPAPTAGFSVAVTKPGTYQIHIYVSASAQGTHWVEAEYAFTARANHTSGTLGSSTTFYVNQQTGNNANSGTSPDDAWKSLAAVNDRTFQPGDIIRFQRGQSWAGFLILQGNGLGRKPIIVEGYGTGPQPVLQNRGDVISITNEGGWTIEGLDLKELASAPMPSAGAPGSAINVTYNQAVSTPYAPIRIIGNHIQGRGENTNSYGMEIGGSFPFAFSKTISQGMVIADNTVDHVGWVGIHIYGWNPSDSENLDNSHLFSDVTVENNVVQNTGDQGIVLASTNHSLIRGNTVDATGLYKGLENTWSPSALWIMASSYDLVEGNRVYDAHTGNLGTDGAGLDIDWTTSHSTFRDNESYDNAGPGIETMANRSDTITHNYFWNDNRDGINGAGVIALTDFTGDVGPDAFTGTQGEVITHNWILVTEPQSYALSTVNATPGTPWANDVFDRNAVVFSSKVSGLGVYNIEPGTAMSQMNHNVFYSVSGTEFPGPASGSLSTWTKATGFDSGSVTKKLPTSHPKEIPNTIWASLG